MKKRSFLSVAALGAYICVGACSSSQPTSLPVDGVQDGGTLGLDLTIGGAQINTVHYDIVGPTNKSGDIDVSSSSSVSALIGGLSAGSGYVITLTASQADGGPLTCTGQASFSVTAGTTTNVPVALSCKTPRTWGTVDINGTVEYCPTLDQLTVSPLSVNVGGKIALHAAASGGDAGAISYKWTTTSGAFDNDSLADTNFNCTVAGTPTVTLTVTSPGCSVTGTGTVTCTAPISGSSQAPYLVPVASGVQIKAFLTTGDSVNTKPDGVTPYRMVGLPDGLGAFDNGDGTFTLLSNHEIGSATLGAVRAHGGKGAFVSRWLVRKSDLTVQHGEDLMQTTVLWNSATSSYNAAATGAAFARFCSADLPPTSALFDATSGLGFNGRLFFDGEETGNEGRAMAHGMDGVSYELPRLGKASWENLVANWGTGTTTVVAGLDDSTPGQVYFYYGTKTNTGTSIEKAGLTNGTLYGLKVTGVATEDAAAGIPSGTAFTLFSLGDVSNTTGATIETNSNTGLVTRFQRPEDGAWDPSDKNVFYFVTTASFTTSSRLWRVRFTDATNPAAGGSIDMLLDGTEGQKMFDNITVDARGHVYLVEDVGGNDRLGKVWRYTIATDSLVEIAHANPLFFDPTLAPSNAASFQTNDEEASGIIDATNILGPGWLLVDVQNHKASADAELVEGGQYLTIYDPAGATP